MVYVIAIVFFIFVILVLVGTVYNGINVAKKNMYLAKKYDDQQKK